MLLLAVALLLRMASAAEPPANLLQRAAAREAAGEAERAQYTYTQTFTLQEYSERNRAGGQYHEVREVIFSPAGERTERMVGRPVSNLLRLRLTDEDFADIRDIQPMLLTPERLSLYEGLYKGEEAVDSIPCWLMRIRPRQLLYGQRLFEGHIWIDQRDFSIIRSEGRAVPQVLSTRPGKENLFPFFTTIRDKFGSFWFPVTTQADDTLPFSTGPVRIRMTIRYRDYKRFSAESVIRPESGPAENKR